MSDRSLTSASDPFRDRRPTSHERMTGQPWDASYSDGPAPWDIHRPQPAIVRLAARGVFAGSVLDAGCGTGENTLHISSLGLPVLGVDVAERALAIAREKAAERGSGAKFATADAFHLDRLERRFEKVLDCGLFHTFETNEQSEYAASLASVTNHHGNLYILCFSDEGPDLGPHPMHQGAFTGAFNSENGWEITAIESEWIETTYHANGVSAWLVTIKRI